MDCFNNKISQETIRQINAEVALINQEYSPVAPGHLKDEIFELLEKVGTLIFYPFVENDLWGIYVCKNEKHYFIINSAIELEKQVFAGAHELNEYESATQLLADEMGVDFKKKRDHNAGEVKSMAMAFAKGFEYFISDDGSARVAAKKHLQKLDGSYLQTIRMKDIIVHVKENKETLGIDRKTAKSLYLYGTSPKLARNSDETKKLEKIRESLKNEFDEKLWPVE